MSGAQQRLLAHSDSLDGSLTNALNIATRELWVELRKGSIKYMSNLKMKGGGIKNKFSWVQKNF